MQRHNSVYKILVFEFLCLQVTINIPTRDQIAVAVREMVNHRVSPTNVNIGVHAAEVVVVAAEKRFRFEKGKEKRNENGNESNANEIGKRVGKRRALSVKLRIWIFHQAILHRLQNL